MIKLFLQFKKFLAVGIMCLLAVSVYASESDMKFEVTVDRNQISLNDVARLTVSLVGSKEIKLNIGLPKIDGFEIRYLGPSTQVTIVNGAYSKTTSYVYNLFPLKEGTFTIPSLTIDLEDKKVSSEPIQISVQGSASAAAQNSQTPGAEKTLEEKIFFQLSAPKNQVYLDQQIPLQMKLYVTDLSVSDIQMPSVKGVGLSVDAFEEPRQYNQVLNGVRYDVVEFNVKVYPTRSGRLEIGPIQIQANLLYRQASNRRRRSGFGSFFDDDFFNNVFDSVQRRPIKVESNSLAIQVKDMPSYPYEGTFSGAVGQFSFDASVSPVEVNVGDPITVRLQVIGAGGLKSIEVPSYQESDDFKVYEPQIKEENDRKILEQVLIARHENVSEVPQIAFSVFDPQIEQYRLIKKGPFPIKVHAAADEGQFKVVTMQGGNSSVIEEAIGKDLIYLKDKPGRFVKSINAFHRGLLNKILYIVFAFILGVGVFILKWINRVQTDFAFAKKIKAVKKAHKQLAPIAKKIDQVSAKEVYDTLHRVLTGYFIDKLSIDATHIEFKKLKSILLKQGIDDQILTQIELIMELSNRVRFASFEPEAALMREHIRKCEQIIADCEKVLK